MRDTIEHDNNKAINAIKYNIRVLNSVVLLIVSILFFLNIKFIYETLDYIPPLSIVSMITIMSFLVLINLYLSRIISRNAIREIEEYDKKLNFALNDLQEEVRERKKIEKKLEHKALHDSLTNIPNREQLTNFMNRVITRPKRHDNYMYAVLFLDLDRFKVINDSLGHVMGDQLLIDVAQRITKCTRPVDKVARFGGDEFIIFLDDITDGSDASYVADRIQNELLHSFKLGEREVFISASIGIALSSKDYNSADEIIRDADVAMYRAKALGRARYEIFDSKLHKSAMKLLDLEADLRRAVENKWM
jgi:diguanylate cyclase (GGDEF)-like protein